MISNAIKRAVRAHKDQKRKGSGLDYVAHPMAVAGIVAANKESKNIEEILAATILHDVIEDSDVSIEAIRDEYGDLVAGLLEELTNNPGQIEKYGKDIYITFKVLGMSSYSLVIKLADRLHNISDNPTDRTLRDTRLMIDVLVQFRTLTKAHISLVAGIESILRKRGF